jgi:predicted ATPase
MSRAGPGPGRRIRAYAYTLVTTAIVLVFALAEWAAERYVSEFSRAASTAIEIVVVLIAALVFRPIHQRVERAVEAAFYKRKRHALDALEKFRRELTSFSDIGQLLRRVIEAIEHHLDSRACAVYLRRDAFHAEASSFDVPAEDVPLADPLAVRLRSSGAPARPPLLKSAALGTHAFPMTTAGDLVGFVSTACKDGEYDAEETQMLAGLAADLATAIVGLDPSLRGQDRKIPNNIPADLQPLIGREREMAELKTALARSRLLTLTGAGGVGKTRIALECAVESLRRYPHGTWFVNLAPITDGTLVAPTLLAALDAGAAELGEEMARVLEHLRARTALIIMDNCEHVVTDVASAVSQISANCPNVTILVTSREILHLSGEQVYRLEPLRSDAAVELFEQRATAVLPSFDAVHHRDAIRNICAQVDGIPLAIELAAARTRTLSPEEIVKHLQERFRLLTGGTRTAEPRQQTLAATIEWSYELLTPDEQSLFQHLPAFRGSFTLPAAVAVCAKDGRCDEFHVLDILTSLADKSLVIVTLGLTTRYRLLETIREFAAQKAMHAQAVAIVAQQHAGYFAAAASQAYHEFDTRLPHGWLARLAPDLDNFRAALEWTLEGDGDRHTGAQMAADCGPIFLRLELLGEGLRWCEAARQVAGLSASTAGRIEYVASMMHNNLGENRAALRCADAALSYYRHAGDERALVRALSQVAQQYARSERFEDAIAPAAEAIRRARLLNEPRVLIAVLRRCAFSLPVDEIAQSRTYFSEALDIARSVRDPEEACMVLEWWANREASAGSLERAMSLATEALNCADAGSQMTLEIDIAGWALALGRFVEAKPHAARALTLSRDAQVPLAHAMSIAYCAPFVAERDAPRAAMLLGYAKARLAELEWKTQSDDDLALENVSNAIEERIENAEFNSLLEKGATWSEGEALAVLADSISSEPDTPTCAVLHP